MKPQYPERLRDFFAKQFEITFVPVGCGVCLQYLIDSLLLLSFQHLYNIVYLYHIIIHGLHDYLQIQLK